MTKRIAVIPLKPEIHRKSRLGTRLTAEVRVRLSMAMFARVTHALLSSGVIDEMFLEVHFVDDRVDSVSHVQY